MQKKERSKKLCSLSPRNYSEEGGRGRLCLITGKRDNEIRRKSRSRIPCTKEKKRRNISTGEPVTRGSVSVPSQRRSALVEKIISVRSLCLFNPLSIFQRSFGFLARTEHFLPFSKRMKTPEWMLPRYLTGIRSTSSRVQRSMQIDPTVRTVASTDG